MFFWCKTSAIDPSDNGSVAVSLLCQYCCAYVNKSSKHCDRCNKCVYNFDHHCAMLNTCIGDYNYRYFISLLLSSLMQMTITSSFSLLVLYRLLFLGPQDQGEVYHIGDPSTLSITSINICVCITSLISAALLVILLLMHLFLKCKGLTTYQYIVQKQKNSSSRVKHDAEMKPKSEILQTDTTLGISIQHE